MACFIVPGTEAIVTTAKLRLLKRKRRRKYVHARQKVL